MYKFGSYTLRLYGCPQNFVNKNYIAQTFVNAHKLQARMTRNHTKAIIRKSFVILQAIGII